MYQHNNRQVADVVLEASKSDPLIKWPTWGHVTVWKIYISIVISFIADKRGRLWTLTRIFTPKLKSSPTSCLIYISHCSFFGYINTSFIKYTLGFLSLIKYIFHKMFDKFESADFKYNNSSFKILAQKCLNKASLVKIPK